jgi:hypothetical protein
VIVSFAGVPEVVGVTLPGTIAQVTPAGAPAHPRLTGSEKPLLLVTLRFTVADCPTPTVTEVAERLVLKSQTVSWAFAVLVEVPLVTDTLNG